jgi:DNA repair protein RecN (Recombination protein N)
MWNKQEVRGMLSSITIQNFAIIDNITIDFKPGMTVLTGETGAGKSIIIDAIGMLLGDRSSTGMIRFGCDKAVIEGVFDCANPKVTELLNEYGIDAEEGQLAIRREISTSGKSVSRINGLVVSLSQLLRIAQYIADIHTQEDNKKLFDEENYLSFIDNFEITKVLPIYLEKLKTYKDSLKSYLDLKNTQNKDSQMLDTLKYECDELTKANLVENEEEKLQQEAADLHNFEKIYENLSDVVTSFKDNNIMDTLHEIDNILKKLSGFQIKFAQIEERLSNSYYEIQDIAAEISNDYHHTEFDEDRLNQINERLSVLADLKRKYAKKIGELIGYRDEISEKINTFENYDSILEEKYQVVVKAHQDLVSEALLIRQIRKRLVQETCAAIKETLKNLHLLKVDLQITFDDVDYHDVLETSVFRTNGFDNIHFLISFNPGEPLKELSKVASGGEMSRVMLALKVHLLKNYALSTIIFDEIDTGVSGAVAMAVANKLKEISQNTQVLAITHLPVVAGIANSHLLISKKVHNDRTTTSVSELNGEKRIAEIAKMIAGENPTESSLQLAKEMIRM